VTEDRHDRPRAVLGETKFAIQTGISSPVKGFTATRR
jgi:hypothetical protein